MDALLDLHGTQHDQSTRVDMSKEAISEQERQGLSEPKIKSFFAEIEDQARHDATEIGLPLGFISAVLTRLQQQSLANATTNVSMNEVPSSSPAHAPQPQATSAADHELTVLLEDTASLVAVCSQQVALVEGDTTLREQAECIRKRFVDYIRKRSCIAKSTSLNAMPPYMLRKLFGGAPAMDW